MSNLITTVEPQAQRRAALFSAKITDSHWRLGAALYIRQSTLAQLRDHQESTARQYALQDRLIGLGWRSEQVIVIDDDLGISGGAGVCRPGFQRLLQLVTKQQVGIVLGLEMSRLARNSKDWHDLFEVCGIFHALIADEDGVYDPHDPNDRLILGMKGIIAEMELHTMKVRLERGRLNKARRGELFHTVPVGYVLDSRGLPLLDPDESARHTMTMFFELFQTVGSSHGLYHYLAEHDIRLPYRDQVRDLGGSIAWRLASKSQVYDMLLNPLYAGAYGYGRRRRYGRKNAEKTGKKYLPKEQWKAFLKDRHPAYITWEQFERNQQRLKDNDSVGEHRGAVREGTALLAGIVRCAGCGRRLYSYYPRHGHPRYDCSRHLTMAGVAACRNSIRCETLDGFVTEKLLDVLAPAGVALNLRVIEDEQCRREQLDTLHLQRVEQARYAADVAERRYRHVDPANRLVAAQLERQWETALNEVDVATGKLEELRLASPVRLSDSERATFHAACAEVSALWQSGATIKERKQIARLLLQRVEVDVQNNSERVRVRLHWCGGYESVHEITRVVQQFQQLECYETLIARALELTLAGKRVDEVASILAEEGYRSPRHDKAISRMMIQKLLFEHPRCHQQLNDPVLAPNQWRSAELAQRLGIAEKRLKDWVTRGWVTAVQRPFGRTWVIFADKSEIERLQALVRKQTGRGRPKPPVDLRTPASNSRKT